MDETEAKINEAVRLEQRLGKIEAAVVANTVAQGGVEEKLETMARHVEKQNGRVDKLEDWKAQWSGVYAAILIAAPFVFWALNRWAP